MTGKRWVTRLENHTQDAVDAGGRLNHLSVAGPAPGLRMLPHGGRVKPSGGPGYLWNDSAREMGPAWPFRRGVLTSACRAAHRPLPSADVTHDFRPPVSSLAPGAPR